MKSSKSTLMSWLVIVSTICILFLAIGACCCFSKKNQAQIKIVDYLYKSLDPFPTISQMPNYGEFYLADGDDEYLIVKNGNTIISAKRNTLDTSYYKTRIYSEENILDSSEQQDIWGTIQEAISSRLNSEASYTCTKNKGPWQLRVMSESEWVITCKRADYPGTELMTYAEDNAEESVGWVVYDDDSVIMYVYLSSEAIDTEYSPQYVFGWGNMG